MFRVAIMFFLVSLVPYQLRSQILPQEGSKLNYRIIGFSVPVLPDASKYKIEVAIGDYNSVDSFTKNICCSAVSDSNKIIAEVPSFGSQYTWRIIYENKRKTIKNSGFYHFTTQMNPHVDTTKLRLSILQPAEAYQDAYVSVDAGGVLYDMNGQPVWYIPDTNGINGNVLGMKFTAQGTITFLFKDAYEINYNGDIVWKAPNKGIVSGDTVVGEFFHHAFTRLPDGNYMVSGIQLLMCKSISTADTSYLLTSANKALRDGYHMGKFGTLIEYDEKGNIIWSWKSSNYLIGSDFDYYESRIDSNKRFDPHDNAFFFDQKNKCIYLGFRNLNRIMKIEYPSGKVLAIYGDNFKPGVHGSGEHLFCNQHSISRSQDGYLYIFNNNSCCLKDSLPAIVMLQEPVSPTDTFKKIWEYTCTVEGDNTRIFGSGGNAIELPDRSIFACMGSEYSKMFIVNRQKKILWSALPERLMEPDNKWVPIKQFSADIISRKDLEKLIWNAETTKH